MASQAEIEARLKALKLQVDKVATEQSARFDTLTNEIKRLTDIITAGGDATPEVVAAVESVQAALQALDDTIPDAPQPPEPV